MQRIIAGEWQIVILSPEMLLSKQFVTTVLRNREFGKRIVSVVVDEAHVVSHWGHNFRKKYGELGIIRAFLPRDTPIVALTATLTRRVRTDIERVLAIKEDHVRIDVGNDRRNVALVVRSMQYAANTFADLDFLVPEGVQKGNEGADAIDSAWIFADNITVGIDIVDHLEDLLPPALRWTGLIRPYNAAMSREYRETVMDLFKKGEVRLLVCTDAAGMVRFYVNPD
jgi:superfamily II DNA helicase RecQ